MPIESIPPEVRTLAINDMHAIHNSIASMLFREPYGVNGFRGAISITADDVSTEFEVRKEYTTPGSTSGFGDERVETPSRRFTLIQEVETRWRIREDTGNDTTFHVKPDVIQDANPNHSDCRHCRQWS